MRTTRSCSHHADAIPGILENAVFLELLLHRYLPDWLLSQGRKSLAAIPIVQSRKLSTS
jgi:hypothetical protein